jgi:hypothetical protein
MNGFVYIVVFIDKIFRIYWTFFYTLFPDETKYTHLSSVNLLMITMSWPSFLGRSIKTPGYRSPLKILVPPKVDFRFINFFRKLMKKKKSRKSCLSCPIQNNIIDSRPILQYGPALSLKGRMQRTFSTPCRKHFCGLVPQKIPTYHLDTQ